MALVYSALNNETIISTIKDAISGKKYFSVEGVKVAVEIVHGAVKPITVNQYLANMKKSGIIFSAGRGWYSSMPVPFNLKTDSVAKTVSLLAVKFPFLGFTSWSMEQIQPFAHHMMAHFTQFIFTNSNALVSVANTLKDNGYTAYQNPQKIEAEKYFDLTLPNVVVIRPSITREPHQGHFASIEKILVDLFLEKDRLQLMDMGEYRRILNNVIMSSRVNISRMLHYAERRKVEAMLLDNLLTGQNQNILVL